MVGHTFLFHIETKIFTPVKFSYHKKTHKLLYLKNKGSYQKNLFHKKRLSGVFIDFIFLWNQFFFSLFKGVIVVIFVSFGKMQCNTFFDKINFENFLLIKVYIQTLKNWERGSKIQELLNTLLDILIQPGSGHKGASSKSDLCQAALKRRLVVWN